MANHRFICKDDNFKFSFDSEENDVNKFAKELGGVKCPKCGKVWGEKNSNIENDIQRFGQAKTLEARRKENKERSQQAIEMANDARRKNPEKNIQIKRHSNLGSPTNYGRAVESVPEGVVESLKKKAISNE